MQANVSHGVMSVSRFPLFVDGAKGVVDEVARFLKSRVVGGSDRLARGVRSDERASRLAAGRPSR